MPWINLLLKGKNVAGAIKSVKPFSKTGAKSVSSWKDAVSVKKFTDSLKEAGDQMTGRLKKAATGLEKLNTTLKKQKKILDK
tara:strand:- start:392 stop:637 length:246 start_codon:yes stop_codon:yes gene_type:complete